MAFGRLVQKEVYIRLTDSGTAFMCTVQYGSYSRVAEFPVNSQPATSLSPIASPTPVKCLIPPATLALGARNARLGDTPQDQIE